MNIQHNIIIEDTTLRDGEQAPGVAFNRQQKLTILDNLIKSGIKWIEVGIPAMGGSEKNTLREIIERGYEANLIAWNRGIQADIETSLALGYKHIHIGVPTSKVHLENSVKKSRQWLLATVEKLIKFTKDHHAYVSISAEDVARTEIDFLIEYACKVKEFGADRLRLSDTIGILNPEQYAGIISNLKKHVDIDLQCHAHNDFGLGVANTLAGLAAGAKFFHATINGIGERAGMPDLAQTVMALKIFHNIDLGLDYKMLSQLSQLLCEVTKTALLPWYPITGKNVFSHESGIHVNGTLNDRSSFEPFDPAILGRESTIIIGKHSGTRAIQQQLSGLGVTLSEEQLYECLQLVREYSMEKSRAIDTGELLQLVEKINGGAHVNGRINYKKA